MDQQGKHTITLFIMLMGLPLIFAVSTAEGYYGAGDLRENLIKDYYLWRLPRLDGTGNAFSIMRERPGDSGNENVEIVPDVDPNEVFVVDPYIIGVTAENRAYIINANSHKVQCDSHLVISGKAKQLGIPFYIRWWLFDKRRLLGAALGIVTTFVIVIVWVIKKLRKRRRSKLLNTVVT